MGKPFVLRWKYEEYDDDDGGEGGALLPGVKWQGREVDYSPPLTAEVKRG